MAFAINGGLVSDLLEKLWKDLLVPVKGVPVVHEAILVAVLAAHDYSATGSANGVGAEAFLKKHALACKFIYIWGGVYGLKPTVIGANGVRRMVVRKDEEDVRSGFSNQESRNQQGGKDEVFHDV
jgi:hypothetical protein